MKSPLLGAVVHSFFVDHLLALKGLRPASIRSYRDTLRLFLRFVATQKKRRLTRITVEDLTFERVQAFLRHLEEVRGNHTRTRNQRLAALHTFFEYVAGRLPEMLETCQRVTAIPNKRVPPPETRFLEHDELSSLFAHLPSRGRHALRDRVLLLFLYNTGARAQEAADLRVEHLDLDPPARARLHGKGDKWRCCPLWDETAALLRQLHPTATETPTAPVFPSQCGRPLTRFGIYKIVRRHAQALDRDSCPHSRPRITPHVFRHTAAVHLLEAGVEVNVIRGWLGHSDLTTTNRYAELSTRSKEDALRACEPPSEASVGLQGKAVWRTDAALLDWLSSL